jgi:hypothetical protein
MLICSLARSMLMVPSRLLFTLGPNRYSTLKAQGYDLQKQIGMGWGPLKYINQVCCIAGI